VPEGDTVWLTARRLHDALAGHRLVHADLRVPAYSTIDLSGRTVVEVIARGKHLLARLDDDRTLHTHLRMDGSWRLYAHGSPWTGGPAHQIRAVLSTPDTDAIGYRVHDLALLPTAREHELVGHLGPDLLGADWDVEEAVRRLSADPAREIGPALLDQRNLAGIGNLYQTEVLFLRGVNPWTPVGEVPDLAGMVRLAQRLLRANRDRWEQITTGNTRRGEGLWAFERPGRPCRRCRTPIALGEQGDPPYQRLTYWCPTCQPGPAPAESRGVRSSAGRPRTRLQPG
jgi:endonuclease-8